jgi:excinuclease ABC subunit A
VRKLLDVIHRLADLGNTVIVIEHNLEVIKTADWVIDLGPEAGMAGGDLVAQGTPEEIVKNKRSQTGKFLKPVLTAGPLAERPRFSLTSASGRGRTGKENGKPDSPEGGRGKAKVPKTKSGESGRESATRNAESAISPEAKAPWEIDGRLWHTRDRIARNGQPARWDGRILERIVDEVEALGAADSDSDAESGFAPTDWSQRNFVKISGANPSRISFPFFHATTSSEWVVTLRFFIPKNTFRGRSLESQLALVAFHESETPVLCDQPRLKITDIGPFQEITIVGHAVEDFDTPGFDAFLRKAVEAFLAIGKPAKIKKASELG